MEKAFIKLIGNIQGLDAAILAIVIVMYRMICRTGKAQEKESIVGTIVMGVIAVTLIIARVQLTP